MEKHSLFTKEGLALYTDGSAYYKDRTGGWAFVVVDSHGCTETLSGFHADVTNNQMELHAITMGLTRVFEWYGPLDVLVYADSEYSVLGARDPSRARRKNKDWWTALDKAAARHSFVEFEHVKGHSTNLYNNIADDLAGKARKESAL